MTGRRGLIRNVCAVLLAAAACGGPQKLGGAGATCFRDEDCDAGLACIAPKAGDPNRVCSKDATPLISMVEGPPAMGGAAASGAAGAGGTGGTGAAGAAGTGGAAGATMGGSPSAGSSNGGAASGGKAGSAAGGKAGASGSGGTDTGGTDTAGSGGTTAGTGGASGSGGSAPEAGAPP